MKIQIKSDNDEILTSELKTYSINITPEEVMLELVLENDKTKKYKIHPDIRNGNNVLNISSLIIGEFNKVFLDKGKVLKLDEYLIRSYIYIGDINEKSRWQFTANLID